MPVAVGQQAPDATLVSGDRKAVKISDLRGKATVLAFFPAAFTGTCTKEMCRFRDDLSRFNALNAQVVGISADTPFVLGEFAKQNQLTFPMLSDFNHEAMQAFGVYDGAFLGGLLKGIAKRSVFVLDKNGRVVYTWIADTPGEPPYDEVQAAAQKAQ